MSAADRILRLLEGIGGWVQPSELGYQLRRRGHRLDQRTIAALTREGLVAIEPTGLTLTDAGRERALGPRLVIRQHRPSRRRCHLILALVRTAGAATSHDVVDARLAPHRRAATAALGRLRAAGELEVLATRADHGRPLNVYGPVRA